MYLKKLLYFKAAFAVVFYRSLYCFRQEVDLSPDNHPEITSPILVSTTATLSPNLLQNIDVLRKQKADRNRVSFMLLFKT